MELAYCMKTKTIRNHCCDFHKHDKNVKCWRFCLGGVAQWTSHPPQGQEYPGSNPATTQGIRSLGKHSSAIVYK
jgi:hypothetical protein